MKTKPEPVPITYSADLEPGTAELTTELNGHDFVIRGDEEELNALAQSMAAEAARPARTNKVASVAVKAAVAAPESPQGYVNLAELSEREAARRALGAFKHDILTFGRTRIYREFRDKRNAELDLQARMQAGVVDRVHCRLHERLLTKSAKA